MYSGISSFIIVGVLLPKILTFGALIVIVFFKAIYPLDTIHEAKRTTKYFARRKGAVIIIIID